MKTSEYWPDIYRLVIVAAVALLLVSFARLCLGEWSKPAWLGVTAADDEGRLIVRWVQPAGLAWDAGVRPGDQIVWIDGRLAAARDIPTVSGASRLKVRSASGAVHTSFIASAAPVSAQRRLSFFFIAAIFTVVGCLVFVLSREPWAASVFFGFAIASAIALIGAVATPFGHAEPLVIEYVAVVCFGASTFLLFLVFPVDRLVVSLGRWCAIGSPGIHLALVAAYGYVLAVAPSTYSLLERVMWMVLLVDLVAASALTLMAVVRLSPKQRDVRRQLGVIAFGATAGVLPFGVLSLAPAIFRARPIVQPDVAILTVVLLPLSLGAAILSRRFLGITRILRRGLVALSVWAVLLLFYSVGFDNLQRWLASQGDDSLATIVNQTTLDVAVVAATFPLLQRRARHTLEKFLFRDVYDYARTLQELGAEIVRLARSEEIANHVLVRLGQTLDLSWAALSLSPAGVPPSRYYWGDCPGDLVSGGPPPLDANANGDCHQRNTGEASCVVPLVANGAANGSLLVGPKRHDLELLPEDRLLISTLVPLLVTALEKASLVDRLEQQVADLEERKHALAALSGRLLRVQEEERRRLALELHDDPLQRAILLARQLERDPNDAQLCQWRQEVEEIVAALRATCMGLRPPTLDDLGLTGGLEWLTSSVSARSDLTVSLTEETDDGVVFPRLAPGLETALYRVAQEALTNCLKHAEASRVAVRLLRRNREIQLWVTDDGRGIPSSFDGKRQSIHLGILGMQEQLRPWGGTVTVEPGPVGGTVVRARVTLGGNHGGAE